MPPVLTDAESRGRHPADSRRALAHLNPFPRALGFVPPDAPPVPLSRPAAGDVSPALDATLAAMPTMALWLGEDGRIGGVNAPLAAYLGRAAADLAGRGLHEVFPGAPRDWPTAAPTDGAEPLNHPSPRGRPRSLEAYRRHGSHPDTGQLGQWIALIDRAEIDAFLGQRDRLIAGLRRARSRSRMHTLRDTLTGLANRRAVDQALATELRRAARTGQPLSVVMLDIDHFKRFNDTYGHAAGDAALRSVAQQMLRRARRAGDVVGRYGGEEFVVLLPGADLPTASARAEAIREGLAQAQPVHVQDALLNPVTASFGVATFPLHARSAPELLAAADAALCRAKAAGRDRVCVALEASNATPATGLSPATPPTTPPPAESGHTLRRPIPENLTPPPAPHGARAAPITHVDHLVRAGLVPPEDASPLTQVTERYTVRVTPELADLIDPQDPDDPIARQFIPTTAELTGHPHERPDPIGDSARRPVRGLIHRYPDRVLLQPLLVCPVYCRFCFRREVVGGEDVLLSPEDLARAFDYIRQHPEIWEVILSGGDPLILSPRRLDLLLGQLLTIDHVRTLRIHTRVPVVDTARVNPALLAVLQRPTQSGRALHVVVHTNHPRELTPAARQALSDLVDAGIPVHAQTVLLRGVNDDAATLETLYRQLIELRVRPYYLHHPDLAPGTAHFRLTIEEGQAIEAQLRQRLSGLARPTYVLDLPGGHGKIPLTPTYLEGPDADGQYQARDPLNPDQTHRYPTS